MPLGCIYVQPSLCQGHWCTRTPMATLGTAGVLVYRIWRGASPVVRFTCKGISYSLRVWSERQCRASRFLFVFRGVVFENAYQIFINFTWISDSSL